MGEASGAIAASRLPLLMLAPIITAYEEAMTEGEGKNTWRTDRYSPCPRQEAGRYLTFLAGIGYQISDIEKAVADGTSYEGDTALGDSLPDVIDGEVMAGATDPASTGAVDPNSPGLEGAASASDGISSGQSGSSGAAV